LVVGDGALGRPEGALAVATRTWDVQGVGSDLEQYGVPAAPDMLPPVVQVLQKRYITLICSVEVGVESFKVLVHLADTPLPLVLVASKEMGVHGRGLSIEVIWWELLARWRWLLELVLGACRRRRQLLLPVLHSH
jgi:hypothetical protein